MTPRTPLETVTRYADIEARQRLAGRLWSRGKRLAVDLLSVLPRRDGGNEWVRFPFYHHVLDDERSGFERHLRFFKQHGDYISLPDAVTLFERRDRIGGRYFCVTFDDGFRNVATNALPILAQYDCRAACFVATDLIGMSVATEEVGVREYFGRTAYPDGVVIDFLSWADCRSLLQAGMTIGAHTCRHVRLASLDTPEARREMSLSKARIERELGVPCLYFAAPWGVPGRDLDARIHPALAKEAGFRALLTTERGPNVQGTDPFLIRRDFLYATWGTRQLSYRFGVGGGTGGARPRERCECC